MNLQAAIWVASYVYTVDQPSTVYLSPIRNPKPTPCAGAAASDCAGACRTTGRRWEFATGVLQCQLAGGIVEYLGVGFWV